MKYFKTQNLYKASNVTFNPSTVEAHSYRHWCFVRVIENKIVFNEYRYSVTTAKHQRKVKSLMAELGIVPDLTVNVRETLAAFNDVKTLTKRSDETTEAQAKQKARQKKLASIQQRVKKLNDAGLFSELQWKFIKENNSQHLYFEMREIAAVLA